MQWLVNYDETDADDAAKANAYDDAAVDDADDDNVYWPISQGVPALRYCHTIKMRWNVVDVFNTPCRFNQKCKIFVRKFCLIFAPIEPEGYFPPNILNLRNTSNLVQIVKSNQFQANIAQSQMNSLPTINFYLCH